jgi:hypothetical protein
MGGGDGLDDQNGLLSRWNIRYLKNLYFFISQQIFLKEEWEEHHWIRIPPPPNISMIKYNSKMVDGMICDFKTPDECQWKIVLNKIVRKV